MCACVDREHTMAIMRLLLMFDWQEKDSLSDWPLCPYATEIKGLTDSFNNYI